MGKFNFGAQLNPRFGLPADHKCSTPISEFSEANILAYMCTICYYLFVQVCALVAPNTRDWDFGSIRAKVNLRKVKKPYQGKRDR